MSETATAEEVANLFERVKAELSAEECRVIAAQFSAVADEIAEREKEAERAKPIQALPDESLQGWHIEQMGGIWVLVDAHGEWVCEAMNPDVVALLVAAPKLLAACKIAVRRIARSIPLAIGDAELDSVLSQIGDEMDADIATIKAAIDAAQESSTVVSAGL